MTTIQWFPALTSAEVVDRADASNRYGMHLISAALTSVVPRSRPRVLGLMACTHVALALRGLASLSPERTRQVEAA